MCNFIVKLRDNKKLPRFELIYNISNIKWLYKDPKIKTRIRSLYETIWCPWLRSHYSLRSRLIIKSVLCPFYVVKGIYMLNFKSIDMVVLQISWWINQWHLAYMYRYKWIHKLPPSLIAWFVAINIDSFIYFIKLMSDI